MTRDHTAFHLTTITAATLAAALTLVPDDAFARPGQGGRGTATSVHRGGGGGHPTGARAPVQRPPQGRPNVNADGNRGAVANRSGNTVNRGGDRINTGNINIGNDVNIDVDRGWDHDGWDYHPVAAGVAFGTAAAVTSAVIGSMVYSLPPSCRTVISGGISYSRCGNVWYQPQYVGSSVSYVVVNAPY